MDYVDYVNFLLRPAFAPIWIILFLLSIRSLSLFIYELRVSRRGGVHAPRMPNDIISCMRLPECTASNTRTLIATSDPNHLPIRQGPE